MYSGMRPASSVQAAEQHLARSPRNVTEASIPHESVLRAYRPRLQQDCGSQHKEDDVRLNSLHGPLLISIDLETNVFYQKVYALFL